MHAVDGPGSTQASENALWRGIDFSGFTVVLGVGTGRLIELLSQQASLASGNLVVLSTNGQHLRKLVPLSEKSPVALLLARPRHIPLLDDTVDLLVVNGVLREVPEAKLGPLLHQFWRVLLPGGQVRISDVIEPSEADYDRAWAERNRIVRRIGQVLERPTALSVDLKRAAKTMQAVGFEDLKITMLPGLPLTDAWLEETVNSMRTMAAGIVDRAVRKDILTRDLPRLVAAYAEGGQRAALRFVLQGSKAGELTLAMKASFTEEDLMQQPQ